METVLRSNQKITQSMCLGTESASCCCTVTQETEADVCLCDAWVCSFVPVASPFGLMLSTAIASLQPKPSRTVKIMSNPHSEECGEQQSSSHRILPGDLATCSWVNSWPSPGSGWSQQAPERRAMQKPVTGSYCQQPAQSIAHSRCSTNTLLNE